MSSGDGEVASAYLASARRDYGFFFSFLNHLRIFAIRLAMRRVYAVSPIEWNRSPRGACGSDFGAVCKREVSAKTVQRWRKLPDFARTLAREVDPTIRATLEAALSACNA